MKTILMFMMCILSYTISFTAEPLTKYAFSCTVQHVRELPDITSNKVGKLVRLEELTVLSREDMLDNIEGNEDYWYKISLKDKSKKKLTGYVFGHNISLRKKGQITRVLRLTECSLGDFVHISFEDLTPSWAMNYWGKYKFEEFCEYILVDGWNDLRPTKKYKNKKFRITYNVLPADCVIDGEGATELCETETIVKIDLVQ